MDYSGDLTIDVISDDTGIREKYVTLARQLLARSGLRSVRSVAIIAMMKEGYFIISVRFRPSQTPLPLSSLGEISKTEDGVIFRLDQARETRLPAIVDTLRREYGEGHVIPLTRYEIRVIGKVDKSFGDSVVVDYDELVTENALPTIISIIPEGFRTLKTLKSSRTLSILGTEHELKKDWVEKLKAIHRKE